MQKWIDRTVNRLLSFVSSGGQSTVHDKPNPTTKTRTPGSVRTRTESTRNGTTETSEAVNRGQVRMYPSRAVEGLRHYDKRVRNGLKPHGRPTATKSRKRMNGSRTPYSRWTRVKTETCTTKGGKETRARRKMDGSPPGRVSPRLNKNGLTGRCHKATACTGRGLQDEK